MVFSRFFVLLIVYLLLYSGSAAQDSINIDIDTLIYDPPEGVIPDSIPTYNYLVRSGEVLFTRHCTECHALEWDEVGPALASVHKKRPLNWLIRFIKNPAEVIEGGDEYANQLYQQYDTLMPSFTYLSDDQIFAMLAYIKSESVKDEIPTSEDFVLRGKDIFAQHCLQCHEVGLQKFGPALASVYKRRPVPWLMAFIRNSQEVIMSGDEYAVFLYERYNNMVMPEFEFLTDEEIFAVLAYIKEETEPPFNYKQYSSRVQATMDLADDQDQETGTISNWWLWALTGIVLFLGLLILIAIKKAFSLKVKK